MNRRGFLGAILAAAVAPAIVRADALMRIVPRDAAVLPAPGGLMVPEKLSGIFTGEIGSYEGVVIHETPLLTRANIAAIIKVMKEREIKPGSDGAYWMALPGDDYDWLRVPSDA